MPKHRKKLIEVSLPLEAINREAARDAAITHGHPSTLHRYWARRPLAACRAVIFASMVDDPVSCEDEFPTEGDQSAERNRLHDILRQLVVWQNSNDENLLEAARLEIAVSVERNRGEDAKAFRKRFENNPDAVLHYLGEHCPAIYDPFCGGGSIPLEAQRLGLRARGSDLNPLPVLLNKAMIELPPQFHNQKPVNPDADPLGIFAGTGKNRKRISWKGTSGLADDIRYYGAWMRAEARQRIGHLYPEVQLPDGKTAPVVAWLWTRTVPCINPACGIQMPLMKTFHLCRKKGYEHWVRPVVDRDSNTLSWIVQGSGCPPPTSQVLTTSLTRSDDEIPKPTVNRTGAHCIACGSAVKLGDVRAQARADKMGETMVAIVAEGKPKLFLAPTAEHIHVAMSAKSPRRPRQAMPNNPTLVSGRGYGITHWHQLFTERQLIVLNTFGDLLSEVHTCLTQDGAESHYADSVCTYLALAIGRTTETNCRFSYWDVVDRFISKAFTRQALQMTWSFSESNPFSTSTQNWMAQVEWIAKVVEKLPAPAHQGEVYQADATTTRHAADKPVFVTDPPYYDNIDYADLSDFFYVWLRPLLRDIYPDLLSGMLTPKDEEIVAIPSRFDEPSHRFEKLLGEALLQARQNCSGAFPAAIFYAYKQQDEENDGKTSTGWETMLMAIVNAGFQIVCTWPMRTEQTKGFKTTKNVLASSILLVCRPRPEDASFITLRNFQAELKKAMPPALRRLTRTARIDPVDLAQAAIGPGMEVYSRYSKVMRISGESVPIREVLKYINDEITAYHEEESGALDKTTQFCLTWFKQHGYQSGDFGTAQLLATATGVDVAHLHEKVLTAARGKVKLFRREDYYERELSEEVSAWEGCQRMVFHLTDTAVGGGIQACAAVVRAMGAADESAERLARVLYSYYEALDDASSALAYNTLVQNWTEIWDASREARQSRFY